jgi:hypothetical protein
MRLLLIVARALSMQTQSDAEGVGSPSASMGVKLAHMFVVRRKGCRYSC